MTPRVKEGGRQTLITERGRKSPTKPRSEQQSNATTATQEGKTSIKQGEPGQRKEGGSYWKQKGPINGAAKLEDRARSV